MRESAKQMDPRSKRILLLATVCLAIAWCWSLRSGGHAPVPASLAEGPTPSYHADRNAQGFVPIVEPVLLFPRREVATNAIVLSVRDGEGNPLPEAVVSRCPYPGARTLSKADRVGVADASGAVVIPIASSPLPDSTLLVASATGLLPRSIRHPTVPGRYEVRLDAGSTLSIECHDFSSLPLPGVRVAVSGVPFPASLWIDTPPDRREHGSDATTTIWHATTDDAGRVTLAGVAPGEYFVRAESDTHLFAVTGSGKTTLHVGEGTSHHVLRCGTICVAALATNVLPTEILYHQVVGVASHVNSGFLQETLDLHRREIQARFERCQVAVAVAAGDSTTHGSAKFSYWTLGHGKFSVDVPFTTVDRFDAPNVFHAPEQARGPTGDVLLKIVGDHEVPRRRLRAELKRSRRSVEGITCTEGELREVPTGRYEIDLLDREMARALLLPPAVEVTAGMRNEIVLRVKDGLVPVTIHVSVPSVLQGQYCSLAMTGVDRNVHRARTRGDRLVTWLPRGTYDLTAAMPRCKPVTTRLVVPGSQPATASISLEVVR
jgi:hypothetical protein